MYDLLHERESSSSRHFGNNKIALSFIFLLYSAHFLKFILQNKTLCVHCGRNTKLKISTQHEEDIENCIESSTAQKGVDFLRHENDNFYHPVFYFRTKCLGTKSKCSNIVPNIGYCFATNKITIEGMKVGYMYREVPDRDSDSGWRFFSGTESQDYVDDPENLKIYDVNTIANYDPDIIPYLHSDYGVEYERVQDSNSFKLMD